MELRIGSQSRAILTVSMKHCEECSPLNENRKRNGQKVFRMCAEFEENPAEEDNSKTRLAVVGLSPAEAGV
jgi:hypothetical protein